VACRISREVVSNVRGDEAALTKHALHVDRRSCYLGLVNKFKSSSRIDLPGIV
jgi:hypothetical protein